MQAKPSRRSRLAEMARSFKDRAEWQRHCTQTSRRLCTYRRGGCWIWGNSQQQRHAPGCSWPHLGPGCLEVGGSCEEHHLPRTEGYQTTSHEKAWTENSRFKISQSPSTCRQSGGRSHIECLRFLQSAHDARTAQTQESSGPPRYLYPEDKDFRAALGMAAICCQPIRRRFIVTVPSWRPASLQTAAAFRSGCYGRIARRVPFPAPRRTSRILAPPGMGAASQPLGH